MLVNALKAALVRRDASPHRAHIEIECRLGVIARDDGRFVSSLDAFVWSALYERLHARAAEASPFERDHVHMFEGAADVRGVRLIVGEGWQHKMAKTRSVDVASDSWFDVRVGVAHERALGAPPASIVEARAIHARLVASARRPSGITCAEHERAVERAVTRDPRIARGEPTFVRVRDRRSLRLCSNTTASDYRRHWRVDFRRVNVSHRRRVANANGMGEVAYEFVHEKVPRYELELEYAPIAVDETTLSPTALAYAGAELLDTLRVALGATRDAISSQLADDRTRFECAI